MIPQQFARKPRAIPLQAEATALIARMTVAPSVIHAYAIHRLVFELKQAGIWYRLDGFYAICAENSQAAYLNWIQDAYNMTASGGTLVPSFGYTFGNPAFLNTTFNPTTAVSPKFTQNDCTMFCFSMDALNGGNMAGAYNGTNGCQLSYDSTNKFFRYRINQTTAVDLATDATPQALFAANRTGATASEGFVNGVSVGTSSVASTTMVSQGFTVGRISASLYGSGTASFFGFGASLTAAQHAALSRAIYRYMSLYPSTVITPTLATTAQTYGGGYIELQPDSFNGGTSVPAIDGTTDIWGFPYSLSTSERARLKAMAVPGGNKGIKYIRFPLGFGYRGGRVIDGTSGLIKQIGERFAGQNAAVSDMISNIVAEGGGLAPEYWGIAPHWTTFMKYGGTNANNNAPWAGGSYARTVTLDSIRVSDPTQYATQIGLLTDAMLNDFEYLHQNVGPVRMYGLQNEPQFGKYEYGSCLYTDQLYTDILSVLHPKILASSILSTYGGQPNNIRLHLASDFDFTIGASFIAAHAASIWSYTYHRITEIANDADWIKGSAFSTLKGSKTQVWTNENEYFTPADKSNAWKCANNMLRDVNNQVYGNSELTMPIIHLMKQIGASGATSNTSGYGLMEVNLQVPYGIAPGAAGNPAPSLDYQTFRPIPHNYNSHLLYGENLPIGAVRVGGVPTISMQGVGLALYTYGGKLYLFVVNRNAFYTAISVVLGDSKTLSGKRYNINEAGTPTGVLTGSTLTFNVPPLSGECWIEL